MPRDPSEQFVAIIDALNTQLDIATVFRDNLTAVLHEAQAEIDQLKRALAFEKACSAEAALQWRLWVRAHDELRAKMKGQQ